MTCNSGRMSWGERSTGVSSPFFANTAGKGSAVGPGSKFQVKPALADCDARYTQAPWAGGIQVGIADGSVRMLSSSITGTSWWAYLTPVNGDLPDNGQ